MLNLNRTLDKREASWAEAVLSSSWAELGRTLTNPRTERESVAVLIISELNNRNRMTTVARLVARYGVLEQKENEAAVREWRKP